MNKEILSERKYKAGYIIREELVDDREYGGNGLIMKNAYNYNGDYIGDTRTAYRLCKKRGILPETRTNMSNVCSIGFSEKDGKWYGWSHRALYGFKIGSKCKKGDCHYKPKNKKDFLEDCTRFWDDKESHIWTKSKESKDNGELGVQTDWKYSNKIPNKKLHNTCGGVFTAYPEKWGKGEWVAKTMRDAKQMAKDFSSGVS